MRRKLVANVARFRTDFAPNRQLQHVRPVPDLAPELEQRQQQLPGIGNKHRQHDDALAKVEERVQKRKLHVDPRHSLHDQCPDGNGQSDKHRAEQQNQQDHVLQRLVLVDVLVKLEWFQAVAGVLTVPVDQRLALLLGRRWTVELGRAHAARGDGFLAEIKIVF